jgi:hypothetical protein
MRILLAGVLGGIAMFVWKSITHMALPLGEAGIGEIVTNRPYLARSRQYGRQDHPLYFPAPEWRAMLRTATARGEEN